MANTKLILQLGASVSGAVSGLKKVGGGVDGLVRKVSSLNAVKIGSLLGFATAGLGVVGVAKKIQGLGAVAESTRLTFQTMLGDVKRGDAMVAQLNEFANYTPFSNEEIIKSGKTLLAFGVPAAKTRDALKMIGDVSAGSGTAIQGLAEIFGKVTAKGKADTMSLNQMIVAGIPIISVLGKQYKKTGEEIYEMAARGEISAQAITQAFASMSAEGGVYAGMMEKQSATTLGLWSTIKGQLAYAAANIGETIQPLVQEILVVFKGWTEELVKFSQNGGAIELISTIGMTAVEMGAQFAKVFLYIKEYGGAALGAIFDMTVARWDLVRGSAMLAFAGIVKGFNFLYEYGAAAFASVGRFATAAFNGILSGVSSLWAGIANIVLKGVNGVISMLNKIPGVDIDMVAKPAFVGKLEEFAKNAGERAKKDLTAITSGQDFAAAKNKAEAKNRKWDATSAEGNQLIDKSANGILSAISRFSGIGEKITNGAEAIDEFANKATDKIGKWQLSAMTKLAAERNAKAEDGAPSNKLLEALAGSAFKNKDSKLSADSLSKVGLYNFGPNSVRSIDRERNNLLSDIRGLVDRMANSSRGDVLT